MGMTVLAFNRSDFENLYRYTFPVVFGSAAAAAVMGIASARRRELAAAGVAGLFLAVVFLPAGMLFLWNDRARLWGKMEQSPLGSVARSVPNYRSAQEAIPAGEAVFVAAAMPNLLDFTRNPLFVCDAPGAASPDPGLPIFEGSGAVKGYLLKKGIRYVMFVDPNEDLTNFSRAMWQRAKEHPESMPETFRFAFPFTLAFLDDMEELGKSEEVVYRDRTLCVVRLR